MKNPWSARFWDERECWSRDRLVDHQLSAIRSQLSYVAARSDWYRALWRDIDFDPSDLRGLEDLGKLPFTTKNEYLKSLEAAPPWGNGAAVPVDEVRRVHFSSGTTTLPSPMLWTGKDLDRWTDLYARMAYSQGIRRSDIYQCLFSYSWFVGGLGTTAAYERIGATVIPGGSIDSERQIHTIQRFGTSAIAGTPSFILHLAEVASRLGIDLRDSNVRRIMVGGEPGGQIPATRARIESLWGAKCFDGYGSLEFQPIAWECEAQAGGHLAEDFAFAEVVDPDSHEPVPDGTPGVLVLTHLDKGATPLVRWWTGDVVVRDSRPCDCGRTHARLPGGVLGRSDDMLVIRGVNVFPSALEEIVRAFPGTTGEYRIVLDDDTRDTGTGYLKALKLQVESTGEDAELAEKLATTVREQLKVRVIVQLMPSGGLPRSTHKANRLLVLNR